VRQRVSGGKMQRVSPLTLFFLAEHTPQAFRHTAELLTQARAACQQIINLRGHRSGQLFLEKADDGIYGGAGFILGQAGLSISR
jgi:hypothetical protein